MKRSFVFAAVASSASVALVVAACSSSGPGDTETAPPGADAGASETRDGAPGGDGSSGEAAGDGAAPSCEETCMPANAVGDCEAGVCAIGACHAHRLDCDDAAANGCELTDDTSRTRCGGCDLSCEDCVIAQLEEIVKRPTISAPVPADCASNPKVCCPNGVAGSCAMELDFTLSNGDLPRLESDQPAGQSRADVTLRMRASATIPVTVSGVECTLTIDSAMGTFADFLVAMTWTTADLPSGRVRTAPAAVSISQFEAADSAISGANVLCAGASVSSFAPRIEDVIADGLAANVCDGCPCQP